MRDVATRKAEIEAEFQRTNAEKLRLEAIARSLADRLCELRGQVQMLDEIEGEQEGV